MISTANFPRKHNFIDSPRCFPKSVIFFGPNEDYHEYEKTIFPLWLYHKQCFVSVLWLMLLLPISVNYAKWIITIFLLLWLVLHNALLSKCFYASSLRHTHLVPVLFKVFLSCDQFALEKSGCYHWKLKKNAIGKLKKISIFLCIYLFEKGSLKSSQIPFGVS